MNILLQYKIITQIIYNLQQKRKRKEMVKERLLKKNSLALLVLPLPHIFKWMHNSMEEKKTFVKWKKKAKEISNHMNKNKEKKKKSKKL